MDRASDGAASQGHGSSSQVDAMELVRRGCELLNSGRLDEALAEFEAAVAADPRNAEAQNKLGVVLARQGKLDEARKLFERALATDPRCAAAMSNLGNTYKESGMLDKAVEFYKMALSVDPEYATAHHNLAVAYRQMGKIDRAVIHFKQASRLQLRRSALQGETARFGRHLWLLIAGGLIFAYLFIFKK
ncbi:MAG: tetratricopeptide repeat protein [Firmicutes bacterium]|nr:tetratricopeptide repeat protein [Bacillota bacterium]MDH7495845.1 tetratricopeptide repeat protein [Bacillota bacterium]